MKRRVGNFLLVRGFRLRSQRCRIPVNVIKESCMDISCRKTSDKPDIVLTTVQWITVVLLLVRTTVMNKTCFEVHL